MVLFIHSWEDTGVHTFPKGICPKVNVIDRLEYERLLRFRSPYIYIYILNMLARIINPQQVGLYRDDGLLYIPNSNGPLSSSIQKRIIRAFNIKIVNFLDVTLDLSSYSYKPFIKSNQNPSYINVNSNYPKNIIKQIPKAVI